MSRMPGVPYDQGAHIGEGGFVPVAGVCHRTQGSWQGDYNIGKHSSGPPDYSGFHFLVGEGFGQWAQFYDTTQKANHAKGANEWSVGIEFSGYTGHPLNYWQLVAGGKIIQWLDANLHIPPVWYVGPRAGQARNWRGHVSVAGSDHTDTILAAEFNAMATGTNTEVLAMGYGLVDALWVPEKGLCVGVDKHGNVYCDDQHPNSYNGGYVSPNPLGPPREDFVAITADGAGYTIITDTLNPYSFRWKS